MSSFNGIYNVRSGLDAARRAMDIVGQNVANANTAGYTRQEVSFISAEPTHVLKAGRGISETLVMRYRDEFLDRQFRARSGAQGYFDMVSTQLGQVEQIVGDLSETGLRTTLDQFFNAWDNLAQRPSDPSARTGVVTAAQDLINQARGIFHDLVQTRATADEMMRTKANQINSAAQQLAGLNKAIMAQEVGGQTANDLRDQRDRLLDSLSKLAGATSVMHDDGTVTVHIGSLPLVDRTIAYSVNATVAMQPVDPANPASSSQNTTTFTLAGNPLSFASGEMGGLQQVRDKVIPQYMGYIDNFVRTVAGAVNAIHTGPDSAGNPLPTPTPIFTASTGSGAIGAQWMDIGVNAAVVSDSSLLMPGNTVPAVASDGNRALAIARIRDASFGFGAPSGTGNATPGSYLQAISSKLGLDVQDAQRQSEAAVAQTAQAENNRQSVSGVSLDDEMTKMIQFQQTYNAAARMMTAMDEMLDVIVNRVGAVGR
jgi:flagellar hook-associated protein 1 FlgK